MAYQLPNNVTMLHETFWWSNMVTGGIFGWAIMIAILIVLSFSAIATGYDLKRSFLFGSTVTAVLGILFRIMGGIDTFAMTIFILFAALMIVSALKDY